MLDIQGPAVELAYGLGRIGLGAGRRRIFETEVSSRKKLAGSAAILAAKRPAGSRRSQLPRGASVSFFGAVIRRWGTTLSDCRDRGNLSPRRGRRRVARGVSPGSAAPNKPQAPAGRRHFPPHPSGLAPLAPSVAPLGLGSPTNIHAVPTRRHPLRGLNLTK